MAGRNQRNEDISDEEMEVDNADDATCDSDEECGLRIDNEIYIPPPPRKNLNDDTEKKDGRLMISKIVNKNFKSYAGEVVIGPFNSEFSAIVGPNGSGKSNVIDSMLFVFGYRASKIRSKKISVLIHNSSEHPNLISCTVYVYFQKIIDQADGNYEVVPNSQVIISRTAFKDSSSYYEMNGKKVHFKEIAKLLRNEGVDLDHNRFLILQGEVEQISLMKPKAQNENDTGMLEFLEDIIGTSRYREPLDKLIIKVDEASEVVAEKTNRLRIVEKEREDMKEPMEEAVDYLKTENVITKLQYKLCHCKKADCTEEMTNKSSNKNELDQEREQLNKDITQINDEKNVINEEIKEKSSKWNVIQQKMDTVTTCFDDIRKKDEALTAELVETNKRRKNNMELVKSETSKLDEIKKVPEKNKKEIEEFERLIIKQQSAAEKESTILEKLMETVQEKTEPLIKKRTDLETKLIDHKKKVNDAKASYDLAESELKIYTTVEQTEKNKLIQLQETLQKTMETLRERKEQLTEFETKIPNDEKSLRNAQKQLETLKQHEHEVRQRLDRLNSEIAEKNSAMYASRSRNQVINALMEEKRRGRLPGIFGRLGDLGAIDAKYDVAISTACGPLDNVVVDTVDTAQACIEFLRSNNIGRATFIPLEKQQRFIAQCNHKITTPENVSRLFDLIKVEDPQVLPAFYYGLHDTLVANDLNQATRIAYGAKRWRVVTLKGELIETSGTMSGGGRTVSRGRMGQSIVRAEPSAVDIEKLQDGINKLKDEYVILRQQQPPIEQQINTLTIELREMAVKRERYKLEFNTLKTQEPSLRAQIKNQEKKTANTVSDPVKVKTLKKVIDTKKIELENVQEKAKLTENEVNKISAEINSITGGKIKEQQKKITTIKNAIDKSKSEICRLQVAIKTSVRNLQKTEEKILTLENDVKACQEKIRQGQQNKAQWEEQAKNLLAKIDEYKEKLVNRDEAIGSLKENLSKIQEKETKLKAVKIDLNQKLTEIEKQISELKHKIKVYDKHINTLKLNEIPLQQLEELAPLTDDEISQLDSRTIAANLAAAKERLPENIPNMQVIKDFIEKNNVYEKRLATVDEVTKNRNKLRSSYDLVKKRRSDEFYAGFTVITTKLKEMYQMITLGGTAELELVDSMDPFSEGIVFSVRPPKKSWKNISNLSGGEKTLSSLALVFALHHYKPTPLYFMDEIDAALDFKNVSVVGTYIKERTKNAQFIVISLRSEMFELADTLVGIYKTYNATKTATINVKALYQKHKKIYEHDKKRKEKSSTRSNCSQALSKACSQGLLPKSPMVYSQFPSTCPAQIDNRSSKSPEEKEKDKEEYSVHNGRASKSPEEQHLTQNGHTSNISKQQPILDSRRQSLPEQPVVTPTPERVSKRISLRRSASSTFSDLGTPVRTNNDTSLSNPKRRKL